MKTKTYLAATLIILLIPLFLISCKKEDDKVLTVTDADGNTYSTVTIYHQIWMSKNLNTTKYNDGTPVPNIPDLTEWNATTSGAYCDYGNIPANSETYGRLYNWYAINTGKLCPVGWHVPSHDEWQTFMVYLGGSFDAGIKIKEPGTAHWESPNSGVTNKTGFTALPGGNRSDDLDFFYLNNYANWWAYKADSGPEVEFIDLGPRAIGYGTAMKSWGMSVRCLKDQ
jgi:uncharacterized protein (TIGR02145 family)